MSKIGVVIRQIDNGWIVNIEGETNVTLRSYPEGKEAEHSAIQFAQAVAEVAELPWCSLCTGVK